MGPRLSPRLSRLAVACGLVLGVAGCELAAPTPPRPPPSPLPTPLPEFASAAGHVHDALGRSIAGAFVAPEPGTMDFGLRADRDGWYSLTRYRLPPGEYRITAGADGYAPVTQHVVLIEGQTLRLDFVLVSAAPPAEVQD